MGPLFGLFGSVSGVVFGQGLAPSSGIYPRELTTADLSISSGPKRVPLLLTSDTGGGPWSQRPIRSNCYSPDSATPCGQTDSADPRHKPALTAIQNSEWSALSFTQIRPGCCHNCCQTQKRHPFLDASLTIELRMVPRVRIELTTCGLGNRCSVTRRAGRHRFAGVESGRDEFYLSSH